MRLLRAIWQLQGCLVLLRLLRPSPRLACDTMITMSRADRASAHMSKPLPRIVMMVTAGQTSA